MSDVWVCSLPESNGHAYLLFTLHKHNNEADITLIKKKINLGTLEPWFYSFQLS